MSILFSPIGTADPITQLGDGPMLHIVRHYDLEKIILFFSPDMAAHQRADARYTKAIAMLAASLGKVMPEIEIIESSYTEVYRFDHYIAEFEGILSEVAKFGYDCKDPVLVNVSSGTPAMEQALVALGSFGRLNIKMLQVLTPRRGVNKRQDREDPNHYDLDAMWEWNEEVQDKAENRIIEVETPNFADRLLRDRLVALVKQYDYSAAYEVARGMRDIGEEAIGMIKAAADRLNLVGQLPAKVFAKSSLSYKANDLLAEYICVMEVRLSQGHWAEFVRSMTPALTEVMKRALSPYLPPNAYLQTKGGVPGDCYDFEAIRRDVRLSCILKKELDRAIPGRDSYVTNDTLMKLVEEYCDDTKKANKIKELRRMERGVRNLLAHTLSSSGRERIEKAGGLNLDVAMQYFFDLHRGIEPGLYDRINQRIVGLVQA